MSFICRVSAERDYCCVSLYERVWEAHRLDRMLRTPELRSGPLRPPSRAPDGPAAKPCEGRGWGSLKLLTTKTTSTCWVFTWSTFDLWSRTLGRRVALRWPALNPPAPSPSPAWTPLWPPARLESCRCEARTTIHSKSTSIAELYFHVVLE